MDLIELPLINATRLLKSGEVCETLRIQPRQLRNWRANGKIAFYRVGRSILFRTSDVAEIIRRGRVDAR